jgi:hypothetical protein
VWKQSCKGQEEEDDDMERICTNVGDAAAEWRTLHEQERGTTGHPSLRHVSLSLFGVTHLLTFPLYSPYLTKALDTEVAFGGVKLRD